jgi:hypothetical protein
MADEKKAIKKPQENTGDENLKKEYDLFSSSGIFKMFIDKLEDEEIETHISSHLEKLIEKFQIDNYNVVFFFDELTSLAYVDSDKIYQSLNSFPNKKDILLLVSNNGGEIEPAFLISQTCKKYAENKFIVTIPRRAKSAATLLSLGADEIHMGSMSELGPIDPQIGGLPALGLGNSLEYIAKIACKYPDSSTMFSQYLTTKLDLSLLGYFERVSESAVQYAERLIGKKKLPNNSTAEQVANKLVYHYKDHSFVIDLVESKILLGEEIIKENTNEYQFSNEVYSFFKQLSRLFDLVRKKGFTYIGTQSSGMHLIKQK